MALRNRSNSLLELCPRVTDLANSISTRMVDYLAISKSQSHSFRELAINFLEVCQTLWPIQAGLLNSSRPESTLPKEVALELKAKVSQTLEDFSSLDLLLSKFLIYERKKGFGKFSKSFGMMFVDSDIHRLSESLSRNRDALRMGSLAFQWVLGDSTTYASMGNAYASLAAVLRIANAPKALPLPATQPSIKEVPKLPEMSPLTEWADLKRETIIARTELDRPTPAGPQTGLYPPIQRSVSTLVSHRQENSLDTHQSHTMAVQAPQSLRRAPPEPSDLAQFRFEAPSSHIDTLSDSASLATAESLVHFEEMLRSYEHDRSNRLPKVAPEPRTISRVASGKNLPDPSSITMRTALVSAVQQKHHKAVEELLNIGVSPEGAAEVSLLNIAIANRDAATIRLLLLFGADPNRADKDGVIPLMWATELGSTEAAKSLLKYGATIDISSGPDDETPLGLAAGKSMIEMVQLYLAHNADVNGIMQNGNTPLIRAINKLSKVEMVEAMIKFGANPNGKNNEGKTPLVEALLIRRVDLVALLLENGASPNLAGPKHPLWPATYEPAALQMLVSRGADVKKAPGIMELAASINSIESVSILLKARVNPNIKKDGVYTPLCSAIRDDHGDIVTLLLENGADPNLPASEYPAWKCITHDHLHLLPQIVEAGADLHNPKGILETAVAYHHKEAVLYLLKQGVNPNDTNADGYTPLSTAIRDSSAELVDILLANGANPTVRGQDWPLSMAVKKPTILKKLLPAVPKHHKAKGIIEKAVMANQLESVKLLVEAGYNVEDKTGGVFSPLTTALREEKKEIVKYLLDEAGADLNAPGEHLPIVKAIRRCRGPHDLEAIDMLLVRGADINLVYRGWNAVMQAIETGCPAILKLLLEKGNPINLEAVDDSGKTVRELAEERGWQEGAAMILGKAR